MTGSRNAIRADQVDVSRDLGWQGRASALLPLIGDVIDWSACNRINVACDTRDNWFWRVVS